MRRVSLKQAIFAILLAVLTCAFTIDMDNKLIGQPEVECGTSGVELQFRTLKPFRGKVYVKGHYADSNCKTDYSNQMFDAKPTGGLVVEHGSCDMDRQRMISPQGMQFSAVIVVSFHPTFITNIDRAFHIKCLYRELSQTVNSAMEVSALTTATLDQDYPMPVCTYTIRKDEIDGVVLRYAKVGERVVHRWECQSKIFGILIHTCFVEDGQGEKVQIVDEKGCHVDRFLIGDPTYIKDLNMAYREAQVFKFADRVAVRFQCQIRLCLKENDGCDGVTPPRCGTQAEASVMEPLGIADRRTEALAAPEDESEESLGIRARRTDIDNSVSDVSRVIPGIKERRTEAENTVADTSRLAPKIADRKAEKDGNLVADTSKLVPEIKDRKAEIDDSASDAESRLLPELKDRRTETGNNLADVSRFVPELRDRRTEIERAASDVSRLTPEIKDRRTEIDNTVADISRLVPEIKDRRTETDTSVADTARFIPQIGDRRTEIDDTMADISRLVPELKDRRTETDSVLGDEARVVPGISGRTAESGSVLTGAADQPRGYPKIADRRTESQAVLSDLAGQPEILPGIAGRRAESQSQVGDMPEFLPGIADRQAESRSVLNSLADVQERMLGIKGRQTESQSVLNARADVPENLPGIADRQAVVNPIADQLQRFPSIADRQTESESAMADQALQLPGIANRQSVLTRFADELPQLPAIVNRRASRIGERQFVDASQQLPNIVNRRAEPDQSLPRLADQPAQLTANAASGAASIDEASRRLPFARQAEETVDEPRLKPPTISDRRADSAPHQVLPAFSPSIGDRRAVVDDDVTDRYFHRRFSKRDATRHERPLLFTPVDGDFMSQYIYVLEEDADITDGPDDRLATPLSKFLHNNNGALIGDFGENVCLSTTSFSILLASVTVVFLTVSFIVFMLFCMKLRHKKNVDSPAGIKALWGPTYK